jgi:hypothetical protein
MFIFKGFYNLQSTPLDEELNTQTKKLPLADVQSLYNNTLSIIILTLGVKAIHYVSLTSISYLFPLAAHQYCRSIKKCVQLCKLKITILHPVTQNLMVLMKMLFASKPQLMRNK